MLNQAKYQKYIKLQEYARNVVDSYAKYMDGYYSLTVNKIPDLEMSNLTSLIIDYYDFDVNHVCDNDVMISLNRMLRSPNSESYNDYAILIREKTISYFEDEISNVIRDACSEKDSDYKDSYDECFHFCSLSQAWR